MKPITQRDRLGCGIACVAMVLQKDFNTTKSLFPISDNGFLCRDLTNVLNKAGVNADYRYIGNKKIRFKNDDIVFIKRNSKYPKGHYLARVSNRWMDSWINFIDDQNIDNAKSGFRRRLPGKPIYLVRMTYKRF